MPLSNHFPTGHPGFDLWPIIIAPVHAPTIVLEAAPVAARQILTDMMATTEWKNEH